MSDLARGVATGRAECHLITCPADGENDAEMFVYLELLTLPREMFVPVAAARLPCVLSDRASVYIVYWNWNGRQALTSQDGGTRVF